MNSTKNLRPVFHITGGTGWINDPNGLVKFNGRYHVFYQYYPGGTVWGPMHWGHCVSDNLTAWERLPIALAPGGEGDKDGCFSGSAIVWRDRIWLLYTGYTERRNGQEAKQVQCLASSGDGVEFIKHGIVIGEKDLPEGYSVSDFRDPKIWRAHGQFWCVVAARIYGGRGRVLLYRSDDLFEWQFISDMTEADSKGIMTECPDYSDGLKLLTVCEQFRPSEGKIHLNEHSTCWYTGELDYNTGKFLQKNSGICDYGFDFYAPQTFAGETVMMGWLNMWDRNNPTSKYGFAGMLTVPRKMEIKKGELWQTPAISFVKLSQTEVSGSLSDNIKVGAISVKAENLVGLRLLMRKKGNSFASLTLENGEWVFNRSACGEKIVGAEEDEDSVAGIRRMPYSGDCDLLVVFDEFSVEIFEGGKALSAIVCTDPAADGLELTASADSCTYTKYGIQDI